MILSSQSRGATETIPSEMFAPDTEHARKCARFRDALGEARASGAGVRLGKATSNLFRHRAGERSVKLDAKGFNRIISIDPARMVADVEGMVPYDVLVEQTLRHGLLPAVVPQLKSITVGGAVSGVGIESSSFRFGLVHETVLAMEVLLGDGRVVDCSRQENSDLFFGFPNSYGTLGYVLRLMIRLIPAKPFVQLTHTRYSRPEPYFSRIADLVDRRDLDYLDGTVFSASELYLTTGSFTDDVQEPSDYTWMKIYYRSIRERQEDALTVRGYIWRWDTDWFWCSKNVYAQNPVVRLLATPRALNSRTYQRIMRLAQRFRPNSGGAESVIQDVDIPVARAAEFLHFLLDEIGITPIWICPFRAADPHERFDLYPLDPRTAYINFGFWDVIPSAYEPGHYNRKVERKLVDLGGKKGLYSTVHFDEAEFWRVYNGERYLQLKAQYDPDVVFANLYEKCTR